MTFTRPGRWSGLLACVIDCKTAIVRLERHGEAQQKKYENGREKEGRIVRSCAKNTFIFFGLKRMDASFVAFLHLGYMANVLMFIAAL